MMSPEEAGASEQRVRRRARAREMWRACQEAARKGGVVTASGACVGVDDDPDLGADGTTRDVTFDLYRTGRGWSAILRLPAGMGKALMMSTSPSPDKAVAVRKAANLASKVLSSPALQAVLPPQARVAAKILQSPVAKAGFQAISKLF